MPIRRAGVASSPSICIPNEQVTTSFWVSEVVNIDGRWYYVYANNMMKKSQVASKVGCLSSPASDPDLRAMISVIYGGWIP